MYLLSIHVPDFFGANQIFTFHPKANIITGPSGSGKSTLLTLAALAMSYYIHTHTMSEWRSSLLRVPYKARFDIDDQVYMFPIKYSVDVDCPYHRALRNRTALPVLLYFPTQRTIVVHKTYSLFKGKREKGYSKWYTNTLQYREMYYIFLHIMKGSHADVLKDAILRIVEPIESIDTTGDEPIFVLQDGKRCAYEDLPSGFLDMVSIVVRILGQHIKLNGFIKKYVVDRLYGIVLIDHLELYMHPKEQRYFLDNLRDYFPQVQFIVTTTSPFILQAARAGEVLDLTQVGKKDAVYHDGIAGPAAKTDRFFHSLEDITEEILRIPVPQRSRRWEKMLEAAQLYYALIQKYGHSTSETELAALRERLDELSAPFQDNPAYMALLKMERAIAEVD